MMKTDQSTPPEDRGRGISSEEEISAEDEPPDQDPPHRGMEGEAAGALTLRPMPVTWDQVQERYPAPERPPDDAEERRAKRSA